MPQKLPAALKIENPTEMVAAATITAAAPILASKRIAQGQDRSSPNRALRADRALTLEHLTLQSRIHTIDLPGIRISALLQRKSRNISTP